MLAWGAIAACGIAATVNTGVEAVAGAFGGKEFAEAIGACVSAPIVEEGMKGLAVLGVFYFLRREFDGVVDGVIYATFAALGFAAVENVIYYSNAMRADAGGEALAATFLLRGVLAPWGHPLYTSMTGIGFGIARETSKPWLKWVAPLGGYCRRDDAALRLEHGRHDQRLPDGLDAAPVVRVRGGVPGDPHLARRPEGADHPRPPARRGAARVPHARGARPGLFAVRLLAGHVGVGRQRGRRFVRTATRLGLSKWHAGRAMAGHQRTVSTDWIVPLRQELFALRAEMARALARPLPMPQAWVPGAAPLPGPPPAIPGRPEGGTGWNR